MIRTVNEQRLWASGRGRQSRWTESLLIVLAFPSLGCARGDWISETLTLVDVTGSWEGHGWPLNVSG